jgi:hypothetical protein
MVNIELLVNRVRVLHSQSRVSPLNPIQFLNDVAVPKVGMLQNVHFFKDSKLALLFVLTTFILEIDINKVPQLNMNSNTCASRCAGGAGV